MIMTKSEKDFFDGQSLVIKNKLELILCMEADLDVQKKKTHKASSNTEKQKNKRQRSNYALLGTS